MFAMWFPAPAVTGTPHNITQLIGPYVCSCSQSLDRYLHFHIYQAKRFRDGKQGI